MTRETRGSASRFEVPDTLAGEGTRAARGPMATASVTARSMTAGVLAAGPAPCVAAVPGARTGDYAADGAAGCRGSHAATAGAATVGSVAVGSAAVGPAPAARGIPATGLGAGAASSGRRAALVAEGAARAA